MGVLAAANSAFAGETLTVPQDKAIERDAAAETISGAREAITESARKAAEALEAENLFYLENKLADITSTLIVSNT